MVAHKNLRLHSSACGRRLISIWTFGQDAPTADPINGVWKLDVDKSKNAMGAPESEVITIVKDHGPNKLTFDVKKSNGYHSKYDIVTDMKGATVKPVNADGRGTTDRWRVRGRAGRHLTCN
jgi:hypothetical protein